MAGKRSGSVRKKVLRLAVWLSVFLLIGTGSYAAAVWYYGTRAPAFGGRQQGTDYGTAGESGEQDGAREEGGAEEAGRPAEGEAPERIVNLIYGFSAGEKKITALVLEVWERPSGSLCYVTIPADTSYQMSKKLYRSLTADEPELPQIVRLFNLYGYYEEDQAFEEGVRIAEELLGLEITYHTVLPDKTFGKYFRVTKKGVWKWKQKWKDALGHADSDMLEAAVTALFGKMKTDWPLDGRLACTEDYGRIAPEEIKFYLMPGTRNNSGYTVDRSAARRELPEIFSDSGPSE